MQEYKRKPFNIRYLQEELLATQDVKLMTEQYDLLYPEVRIIDDDYYYDWCQRRGQKVVKTVISIMLS